MKKRQNPERTAYSVAETARQFGVSRVLASNAVRNGQLPAILIGKRYFVPKIALERMLEQAAATAK